MIATAVATSFQSQDPQFLKTDPQFLKSAETPEKQSILGGKNCSWSLKKNFQSGNGCAMSFLQKNSVKGAGAFEAPSQTMVGVVSK